MRLPQFGEALRRIGEGAAMMRTKGEPGTGDVVEAVRHARSVYGDIRHLQSLPAAEVMTFAKNIQAPYELCLQVRELGALPVVNFAAGGIATPADAALMMQLGVDGVFVGSGIFKSGDPSKRAQAIVKATTHYNEPKILAEVSRNWARQWLGAPQLICPTPRRWPNAAGRGLRADEDWRCLPCRAIS
jgi:pyridoxal 5'-phosphate synthase pdxS subunit